MRLLNPRHTLPSFTPHIPDLNALISRTRTEHRRFRRTPLDILHTRCMRHEWLRKRVEPRRSRRRQVDFTLDVSREETKSRRVALSRRGPVHSESFRPAVRVDSKCRLVCAIFVWAVTWDIEGFD